MKSAGADVAQAERAVADAAQQQVLQPATHLGQGPARPPPGEKRSSEREETVSHHAEGAWWWKPRHVRPSKGSNPTSFFISWESRSMRQRSFHRRTSCLSGVVVGSDERAYFVGVFSPLGPLHH